MKNDLLSKCLWIGSVFIFAHACTSPSKKMQDQCSPQEEEPVQCEEEEEESCQKEASTSLERGVSSSGSAELRSTPVIPEAKEATLSENRSAPPAATPTSPSISENRTPAPAAAPTPVAAPAPKSESVISENQSLTMVPADPVFAQQ